LPLPRINFVCVFANATELLAGRNDYDSFAEIVQQLHDFRREA